MEQGKTILAVEAFDDRLEVLMRFRPDPVELRECAAVLGAIMTCMVDSMMHDDPRSDRAEILDRLQDMVKTVLKLVTRHEFLKVPLS